LFDCLFVVCLDSFFPKWVAACWYYLFKWVILLLYFNFWIVANHRLRRARGGLLATNSNTSNPNKQEKTALICAKGWIFFACVEPSNTFSKTNQLSFCLHNNQRITQISRHCFLLTLIKLDRYVSGLYRDHSNNYWN
jgi:hypothetical protein